MAEIKPQINTESEQEREDDNDNYYPIEEDGVMKCSCGTQLIKKDDVSYECPAGSVVYRFDDGSLMIDKFGNVVLKHTEH